MMKERTYNNWLVFAGILLLASLTRLPQITSPLFFPDGDECVVGLMAKHISEGKEFPVYFYGQNFGFSMFEVVPAAIAFKIFGVSAYALKITMLLLWVIGIWFLFRAGLLMGGKNTGWLLILLMLFAPAWFSWSMKARGGYISAFLFSAILLFWLVKLIGKERKNDRDFLVLGLISAVVMASQTLWLPGLLPFFVWLFFRKGFFRNSFFTILGFLSGFGMIYLLSRISPNDGYWNPKIFEYSVNIIRSAPEHIYTLFQGNMTLFLKIDTGIFTDISAWIWLGLLIIFLTLQIYRLAMRQFFLYSHLFAIGILLTISYLFFINIGAYNPRYLLPLVQWLAAGLALEMGYWLQKTKILKVLVYGFIFLVAGTGAAAAFEFRKMDEVMAGISDHHTRLGDMDDFVNQLTAKNIHYFYAINPLAEWTIIFLSNEQLIGKCPNPEDRYPEYVKRTNDAYFSGKPFAITGSDWQMDKYVQPYVTSKQFHSGVCSCNDLCAYINPLPGQWEKIRAALPK